MDYTRSVYADVNASLNLCSVKAKQGDKTLRKLEVNILKDSVAYTPDSVSQYQFRCSKPDGNAVVLEGNGTAAPIVADGNIVTITLSEQCLVVAGRCMCDLAMYDSSGNILSTANFVLEVVPMPNIASIIESSTEWKRLQEAIEQAEGVVAGLDFRVSNDYFQYTTDGENWTNICPVSDFVGTITDSQIDALFA